MISLIVCTYNRRQYIYSALQHIAANRYDASKYEIVLVNNNSTDDTEVECKRFVADYSDVPFYYFIETKQGLSHARNRGIHESKGDVLVFLDDDSLVDPDYLPRLEQYMVQYPDMMAFGGRITPLFESGVAPVWLSPWTYSWVSAIDMGKQVRLFEGGKFPIGANMGIRRECIDKIGLFNTSLGRTEKNLMGGEEKDLFNRVKAQGMPIYYFPYIHVHHVIPPQRTTDEFIERMADGIGVSERVRTCQISKLAYFKRLIMEVIKWGGTFVLFFRYMFEGKPKRGSILLLFRSHVTRGLLGRAKV